MMCQATFLYPHARETLNRYKTKLQEQESHYKAKEASLLNQLNDVGQRHREAVDMYQGMQNTYSPILHWYKTQAFEACSLFAPRNQT